MITRKHAQRRNDLTVETSLVHFEINILDQITCERDYECGRVYTNN